MAISMKILIPISSVFLLSLGICRSGESTGELPRAQQQARTNRLEQIWEAPGDTVVGKVNGVNITKDELLRHLWLQSAPAALDDLMKNRAIKYAADSEGITIDPDKLESKVQTDIRRTKSKDLNDLLKNNHMTEQRYKGILLGNMLLEEYVRRQATIVGQDYDKWVKARYIFVGDSAYESDLEKRNLVAQESKKKAERILGQIKDGKDFAEAADEYSDSPENVIAGKKQGGSLGWISRGQMQFSHPFEETCFALKAGGISDPVRADFGWYLIKVEAVGKDTSGKDLELNRLIVESKVRPSIDAALDKILTGAKLENRLTIQ